jgi:hypothetical protein
MQRPPPGWALVIGAAAREQGGFAVVVVAIP